jgi:predicted AAA+ superfamily ATPase
MQCHCIIYIKGLKVRIQRKIGPHLTELASQFPVVAVMGPRQAGKTTLVKETFPTYAYVTLEDLDRRQHALEDPRAFFATYAQYPGLIIDEIQGAPALLSYMQGIVDQAYRPGYFVITGSQHFLMYEKITQTLAGRIALLTLLPLSVSELQSAQLLPTSIGELLIKGCYPRPYVQPIPIQTWCANYISTYVEKDVRQVLKVTDLIAFQRFLKLCAARVGTILNYADLARDADISPHTAKAWLSILEASYIITLLAPYYRNFNKRVIKNPKLHFYDSALVCSLLGIRTAEELLLHPLKDPLFESFVLSEMFKYNYNHNELPKLYFWRDTQGHEIDCLIEKSFDNTVPVEVKASMTAQSDFFKGLLDWQKISDQEATPSYVVYAGNENLVQTKGAIYAWHSIDTMLKEIYRR